MEFKGTKGKWVLDGEKNKKYMVVTEYITEGNVICLEPDICCVASREKWIANALLISKAPEMLEMLQKCAEFMDRVQAPSTSANNLKKEIEKLIKEATEL